jgi:hypothetical protein
VRRTSRNQYHAVECAPHAAIDTSIKTSLGMTEDCTGSLGTVVTDDAGGGAEAWYTGYLAADEAQSKGAFPGNFVQLKEHSGGTSMARQASSSRSPPLPAYDEGEDLETGGSEPAQPPSPGERAIYRTSATPRVAYE